jgi:putative endonuclease
LSGSTSYHAGLSAEASVSRTYQAAGYRVRASRFRGKGGEIDVIVQRDSQIVFVEVKKSASHATAALRLSERQIGRLFATASEFLAQEPNGQDTDSRFDIALVDRHGVVEILENALTA